MDNLAYIQTSGNPALLNPMQVESTIDPIAPSKHGPRVLELRGLLQTTLEVHEQVALFSKELRRDLNIDGIDFVHPHNGQIIETGKLTTRRASYDLKVNEQSLGTVRFYREIPYTFNELRDVENLLCALVYPLRNALAYSSAVQLALRDPLTGIQNRMALEEALPREVELAHRQAMDLSMLIIDADFFKRFNDNFGHAFGDEVLRTLAGTANHTIRRSDLMYRFGGEEFVVLAAHTDGEGAKLLAERIRENIENIKTIKGTVSTLTVSVGVATLKPQEEAQAFFERADEAMYEAKNTGRNKVAIAD